MTEEKDTYTIEELYDNLPCTLIELGRRVGLSEVSIARIRDGKPVRRSSVNALLRELSKIYERPLTLLNVTGINVQRNKRLERKQARGTSKHKNVA